MMNAQFRTLMDVMLVLALGLWACRFMWRGYRQPRRKQGSACDTCRKCGH